jgi:hypothetical protein
MPDQQLADTGGTDLVIVPALAGNIAEELQYNAAFIPWMRERYHAGAEIAGLCTSALFIAHTGLISDEHCSADWFVDAAFRREFAHINLIVHRAAPDERAIHSAGSYFFLHRSLKRSAGREVASACKALFETLFNRQCQSVLAISDQQKHRPCRKMAANRPVDSNTTSARMTMEQFASRFAAKGASRSGTLEVMADSEGCAAWGTARARRGAGGNSSTLRTLFKGVPAQARLRPRKTGTTVHRQARHISDGQT